MKGAWKASSDLRVRQFAHMEAGELVPLKSGERGGGDPPPAGTQVPLSIPPTRVSGGRGPWLGPQTTGDHHKMLAVGTMPARGGVGAHAGFWGVLCVKCIRNGDPDRRGVGTDKAHK